MENRNICGNNCFVCFDICFPDAHGGTCHWWRRENELLVDDFTAKLTRSGGWHLPTLIQCDFNVETKLTGHKRGSVLLSRSYLFIFLFHKKDNTSF